MVWLAECVQLCTKNANKSVFAYLVGACLKCAMPKSVCLPFGALNAHTSALIYAAKVSSRICGALYLEMHHARNVCLQCGAPNALTLVPKLASKVALYI